MAARTLDVDVPSKRFGGRRQHFKCTLTIIAPSVWLTIFRDLTRNCFFRPYSLAAITTAATLHHVKVKWFTNSFSRFILNPPTHPPTHPLPIHVQHLSPTNPFNRIEFMWTRQRRLRPTPKTSTGWSRFSPRQNRGCCGRGGRAPSSVVVLFLLRLVLFLTLCRLLFLLPNIVRIHPSQIRP